MKLVNSAVILAALLVPAASFASTVCPAIGNNTTCGVVVTANANGTYTVANTPGQGPYDGIEDTLVGFVNNSGNTINSLILSNPGVDIFGFDNDGIDANPYNAPGNALDTSGYGGPLTYFTAIDAAKDSGTANFIGGIATGSSTYFSLEEDLTGASGGGFTAGSPTPEPSSLILLGTGALGLITAARRRVLGR